MVAVSARLLLVGESHRLTIERLRSIPVKKAGNCRKVARLTEVAIPFLLLLRRGDLRIHSQTVLLQVFQILPRKIRHV